jgi:hypothetical protein
MKLAIFYHIGQMGLGAFIYQQQIHRLYASGLIKEASYIHFGVNGTQELFNVPSNVIVNYNQQQNWDSEKETLLDLRNFCIKNPDYKVFYFHTKGSSKSDLQTSAWRLYMEYYTIDKWKECIEYLNDYDCCGTDYYSTFFAGNFWWANASYVNTLDDEFLNNGSRLDKELWIGSNSKHKGKCLFYSKMNGIKGDFYLDIYNEKEYIK